MRRQYLYFGTSKASKVSCKLSFMAVKALCPGTQLLRRQYLYFGTSKASKASKLHKLLVYEALSY
jgi:hypothetical protein